ncbi:bacteriocin [Chryseobacterium sp. W4I1]|uniref:bacteriocin n=1 Tax=Chryseobacterium sp. W4I1 TaxID=3042293 RepID=UPI002782D15D|nr:bacteriocin [Chryseobacterium sp. W4I1]MDQ0782829.1 bacteriocin-like protein [Chryseobacterium sp. W4I1]
MKKLTKKDLKKINGGSIRFPDANGNCLPGWYLCPTNVCINDNGGENPIQPGDRDYFTCFGHN